MLKNRAETLSIAIKLRELAIHCETFVILWATFQACVGCDRQESMFVLQMQVSAMLVSTNVDWRESIIFVWAKATRCMTISIAVLVSTLLVSANVG